MPSLKSYITTILSKPKALFLVVGLLVIGASLKSHFAGPKYFGDVLATHYNNYLIFKHSFWHLWSGENMYIHYPSLHWDLFKYSPTFALAMAPFSLFPDFLGLLLWNALNAFVLLLGIFKLPFLARAQKIGISWLLCIELMTNLQNAQSNALIAGLILLGFSALYQKKYFLGNGLIWWSAFVKIFGVVAFALWMVFEEKGKSLLSIVLLGFFLFLSPIILTGWEGLLQTYTEWGEVLSNDHGRSFGLSVMGWLQTWFGLNPGKMTLAAVGVLLFCLPLLQFRKWIDASFRFLLLASILIWVVIFNHMAESPTFIIAATGVGLWYFSFARKDLDHLLLGAFVLFTMLSPTDVFPQLLRKQWVEPYVLKAVPVIFIWMKILYEMYKTPELKTSFSSYSPLLVD